jgi:uncharacterized protein
MSFIGRIQLPGIFSLALARGPDGRIGDYIRTYSGGRFWPLDPRAEDVKLEDVAHHLSLKNRFNGATRRPLTVAQHAVMLSKILEDRGLGHLSYAALHHDDSEAFLPDVPTPVKPYLKGWHRIEAANMKAIAVEAFGVDPKQLKEIKPWDKSLATDEAACNLNHSTCSWKNRPPALGIIVEPWPPEQAEEAYLARHFELLDKKIKPCLQHIEG